ncbi:MAG: ribonuclease J [Clostridium sp.]
MDKQVNKKHKSNKTNFNTKEQFNKMKMESKEQIRNLNKKTKINNKFKVAKNNVKKNTTETIKDKKNVKNNSKTKSKLKIIPLGGLEEIGKNITVFEYEDEMIMVDCGLSFPEDDMLGVDIVIPDFTYLEKNRKKIKGLVVTHGHEDHIGAIPYFLKKINVPIYAMPLTIGLINNKLKEHKLDKTSELNVVHAGDVLKLGRFSIEFILTAHSIPDACMLAIKTPVGTVVHTGDFKVDFTPVDGKHMDLSRLGELGNEGVLALLSDSTNAEKPGYTMSEKSVGKVFESIFENCTKRIIVATFASNVNRIQELINLATKYNRKVAVSGRSMEKMLDVARELEYINAPSRMFIELDAINTVEDEHLLIITTGSQGEPMSALTRIAVGQHKQIKLSKNDLVIISATPIPGNEPSVSKVINGLMKRGVEVIYSSLQHIHVSGHACQEEQKLILALTKPKFFIPVHGEVRQIYAHKNSALSMGYKNEDVIILENGRVLEIDQDGYEHTHKVECGKTFVDGLGVGDVGNIVLRDRQLLSQDGLIIVVLNMSQENEELISEPDIISRGFVYVRENEELLNSMKELVKEEVQALESKQWSAVKSIVKSKLQKFIFKKTKRDPMILPIIVEV